MLQKLLKNKFLWFWIPCVILGVTTIFLWGKYLANQWNILGNSDFMTLWLAGKSVVLGFDAYDSVQWPYWREYFGATIIFDPVFIFPLPLRLFLTPLGLFSFQNAYIVWAMLSQVVIVVSTAWLLSLEKPIKFKQLLIFMVFGVYFFRPTYTTLYFGQIGPWLLLALVVTLVSWQRESWFLGGVILALTMLKPTVGGIYLLFIFPWLLLEKRWKAVAGLASGGIGLLLIGMVQDIHWVEKFLQAGGQKFEETFGYGPNVWGFARLITRGQAIYLVGGVFTVLLIVLLLRFCFRYRSQLTPFHYFALISPIIAMVTPYIWVYDQLYLLISLSLIGILLHQQQVSRLISDFVFLFAAILSYIVVIPAMHYHFDYFGVFLPLIVLGVEVVLLKRIYHHDLKAKVIES